jgi:hypothetical protein
MMIDEPGKTWPFALDTCVYFGFDCLASDRQNCCFRGDWGRRNRFPRSGAGHDLESERVEKPSHNHNHQAKMAYVLNGHLVKTLNVTQNLFNSERLHLAVLCSPWPTSPGPRQPSCFPPCIQEVIFGDEHVGHAGVIPGSTLNLDESNIRISRTERMMITLPR